MGRVPGWLLRHRITVEPYRGTWGSFGAGVDVRCFVAEKLAGGAGQAGDTRTVTFTVVAGPEADIPAGSRITLPDGRVGYASASARHDGGGLPTPDHVEAAVTVGGEYGPPLGGEVVVVLRRVAAGVDRYHNVRYTTTAASVPGCAVRPLGHTESDRDGRNVLVDTLEVIAPPGTAVEANDRLQVRGLTYEVDGTPVEQHDPMTGAEPGVRIVGKRVAGA